MPLLLGNASWSVTVQLEILQSCSWENDFPLISIVLSNECVNRSFFFFFLWNWKVPNGLAASHFLPQSSFLQRFMQRSEVAELGLSVNTLVGFSDDRKALSSLEVIDIYWEVYDMVGEESLAPWRVFLPTSGRVWHGSKVAVTLETIPANIYLYIGL